jgi:hypothetical protein
MVLEVIGVAATISARSFESATDHDHGRHVGLRSERLASLLELCLQILWDFFAKRPSGARIHQVRIAIIEGRARAVALLQDQERMSTTPASQKRPSLRGPVAGVRVKLHDANWLPQYMSVARRAVDRHRFRMTDLCHGNDGM